MIVPGLLTASTSRADHFGMSADCLLSFSCCIFVAPSFGLFLKGCFPLAAKEGTRRGCPLRTPEGATKWSTRREAKSCADGLVVYDEAERGGRLKLASSICIRKSRRGRGSSSKDRCSAPTLHWSFAYYTSMIVNQTGKFTGYR